MLTRSELIERSTNSSNPWKGRFRASLERRRKRLAPADLAREQTFRVWSEKNGFIVDREPVDFAVWKYLAQVYEAIPRELASTDPKVLELVRGFDITIMKGAQSGGSIIFLLLPIW